MGLAIAPSSSSVSQIKRVKLEDSIRDQVAAYSAYTCDYVDPMLLMSEARLRDNARRFIASMPRVRPHFAVKANPHPEVLRIFKEEGTCFEIASIAEIDAMKLLNVSMDTVFYSNPIKSPASVKYAAAAGIIWYVVDTPEEVEKIASIKPDAKLYLRIDVSNEGSVWPLSGKFGASPKGAAAVVEKAAELNMPINGITFHVGSQCINVNNWVDGIRAAKQAFERLEAHGWTPELLNIGGGYPVQFSETDPSIEEIGEIINQELDTIPLSIQVMGEPGRFLAGAGGCLLTQIIGMATRDQKRWLFLDTGFYGGLMEVAEKFPSTIVSQRTGAVATWALAGPTCDSIDVLGDHELPCNIEVNDVIFMPNMGAYCTTCACDFNGFPVPNIIMVD
ncbi:MAG: type III PLP-dependent enzyme [Porticoccaceae bacterium]|nr:type III PLP-dependent enzyme [Porticoccaceae bacterium]MDG1474665.1 type III PLP-dependent enzyme [Porticoccaceae bacterium]